MEKKEEKQPAKKEWCTPELRKNNVNRDTNDVALSTTDCHPS